MSNLVVYKETKLKFMLHKMGLTRLEYFFANFRITFMSILITAGIFCFFFAKDNIA